MNRGAAPWMRGAVALVAAMLVPAAAAAQNASTAGALELYPTFQAVGARLAYTGDADSDAVAHLEWRNTGAGAWNRGMDLTRIRGSRWAGSLLWLDPDEAVDIRAVIEDPDGGGTTSGATRTRRNPDWTMRGRFWWVATSGSDQNPGTSAAPLATLQAAVDRANPGDEVRVRPGLYYQSVHITRAGLPGAPIHLVADGPGVILDGSDPAWLSRSDWRNDGGGVFSLPFAAATRLVCADTAQRLYHQATLADLQSGGPNAIAQGWVVSAGRLNVRLEDGSTPNGHTMHVARLDVGILVEADDWFVSGFEIRCFGTTGAVPPDPIPHASGVLVFNARRGVVRDVYTHAIGGKGIYLLGTTADAAIEHNLCVDPRISRWAWAASKNHEEEIQGISNYAKRGNVIRSNRVRGTFDGIDGGDIIDENYGADMDIHDNLITDTRDDALEPEYMAAINVRIWGNRADRLFNGISISPDTVGPMYVLYNTITNYTRSGFKFSLGSIGHNWICHNTLATSVAGAPAVYPSGPYSNDHFRDNIMVARSARVVDDYSNRSQTGNDFDGDLLYSTQSTFFTWKDADYTTIAALRAATGFEVHGIKADPMFADTAAGNYALKPGSPAIDAALRLFGIDDCYTGAAPDMGAGEYCHTAIVGVAPDPPPAPRTATLEPPFPDPARGEARIALSLIEPGPIDLAIYDLAGRRMRTLARGSWPAGRREVAWDGRRDDGAAAPTGVYFVRLVTSGGAASRRLAWRR